MRRKLLASLLVVLIASTGVWAQQEFAPKLSAPTVFKPAFFQRAFFRPVKYQLEAPPSLKEYAVDGKLNLSLSDVVRLVVQRNTDVWIARLNLQNADTSVLRAYSKFDPTFTSSFSNQRSSTVATNTASDASTSVSGNAQFRYNQALATGTQYYVTFSGSRASTNNSYQTVNPTLKSNIVVSVSQPLLRDRGFFIQRSNITIAKINAQVSRRNFETSLMNTLQQAMNQYWSVIQSRESLNIARRSLDLNDKSYQLDKRKLELGALPPLDIFQSQSRRATAEVAVTQSEFDLSQQEDILRRLIAADLDPDVRNLPMNLTDSPIPSKTIDVTAEEQIKLALANDIGLDNLRRTQVVDDINVRTSMNSLKPNLTLGGSYQSNGTSGHYLNPKLGPIDGGFYDALDQMFQWHNPTYGFSLNLNFPIRDRAAQAVYADALITQRRNIYNERGMVQSINLNVKNAINRLEQAKATMKNALIAQDLAQKNVEAEQKKYELGAEIMINVLNSLNDLANAQTRYMNATISYQNALIGLQVATATLLKENSVVVEQAMRVTRTAPDAPAAPATEPPPTIKRTSDPAAKKN